MLPTFKNRSVDAHSFAMVPRADIPRSSFEMQTTHKTTFDSGYLIPVYLDEVLPGDRMNISMTLFGRLATPIFPVMDNLHLDWQAFFCPNRLLWSDPSSNWKRFMGEQPTPASSIAFTVPQTVSPAGGFAVGSLFDYLGLPTVGQVTGGQTVSVCSLPLRMYNLVWNEWYRDENLQDPVVVWQNGGPDTVTDYSLLRRGKRKDYFTGALPWPQKSSTPVSVPLGTSAPVFGNGTSVGFTTNGSNTFGLVTTSTGSTFSATVGNYGAAVGTAASGAVPANPIGIGVVTSGNSGLYADLSTATAATINQLRQAFQIQRLLERDARGGTRYIEMLDAHFGVRPPDFRLQRPEFLGGGSVPVIFNPIAQTSATGVSGGTTPVGTLTSMASVTGRQQSFSYSATEHGYIMVLVSVRADLSYQQGLARHWSRLTRYDYYFPVFAALGEQAILNKEIYCVGGTTQDNQVFGYQERWAEYRYKNPMITGLFRSTSAGTIDPWHLAQKFTALPTLNSTFIQDTPPVQRVVAVGAAANGQQIIFDSFFNIRAARPMPLYSVPGMIDHF